MDRRVYSGILAAALATALAVPTAAVAAPSQDVSTPHDPGMIAAVQEHLNLTESEAKARLATEEQASETNVEIRKELGARYAGGWLNESGDKLIVGVTDAAAADAARADGAEPRLVDHSEAELEAVSAALEKNRAAAKGVASWYVDVTTNTVVVNARTVAAGTSFVRSSGVDRDAVRVVRSDEAPRPLIDVVGGNAYYIGSGSRCSVGFPVTGGFVTAGHCGRSGAATTQPSGQFAGSSFPGNDYAWVRVNSGNTIVGAVNNYSGGRVAVAGSQDAAVGATVCRSGSTTGWHCGTIQARNSSVTYPEGTVSGLIRTTVCAEPGDSGGSLLAGSQAQGVTSGGSGNCSSGGTTYFQPVNEILQAYGLTLATSGGGGNPPPGGGCSNPDLTGSGSLSSGASAYQPNGSYYQATGSGTHAGCLDGPSGTDFDLYLQKWNGSAWANVASGATASADESLSYNGTAGYYRYRVHAYSGSGQYTLRMATP